MSKIHAAAETSRRIKKRRYMMVESPTKTSPLQLSASHSLGMRAFKLKLTNCFVIPNRSSYAAGAGFIPRMARLSPSPSSPKTWESSERIGWSRSSIVDAGAKDQGPMAIAVFYIFGLLAAGAAALFGVTQC